MTVTLTATQVLQGTDLTSTAGMLAGKDLLVKKGWTPDSARAAVRRLAQRAVDPTPPPPAPEDLVPPPAPVTYAPPTGSPVDSLMLVDLTVHMWVGTKHDRKASKEVATTHNTDESSGRYIKKLGTAGKAGELLAAIRRQGAIIAWEHRRRTVPWMDGGTRVLSSAGYFEYVKAIGSLIADYDVLCDRFAPLYPSMIDDDRAKLNGLFDASDYPSAGRIRTRFGVRYAILPFPTTSDFRKDVRIAIGDEEFARVVARTEATMKEAMTEAVTEVIDRVRKVVARMSERLHAYDDSGDRVTGNFHATLVSNVADMVDLLPSLNVTGDAFLADLTARMRTELLAHDVQELKDAPEVRSTVADAADRILAQMTSFV